MTLQEIQKTLKAPKNQNNDFGHYKYRNCEDILEAVKPLLGDSSLTLSDEMVVLGSNNPYSYNDKDNKGNPIITPLGEQRFYIKATAILFNADGSVSAMASGYARESESKKGMDVAQITGAASSYARKYALNGLFLIDDTKDADTRDNRTPSPNKPVDLDRSGFGKLDYSQMIQGLEECQDLEQLKTVFAKVYKGVGNDKQGQDILTAKKDELKISLSRSPV